jgi:DNA-binding Lrp family transcriptional regulator
MARKAIEDKELLKVLRKYPQVSNRVLSELVKCSRRTIIRRIKVLQEEGLITIQRIDPQAVGDPGRIISVPKKATK